MATSVCFIWVERNISFLQSGYSRTEEVVVLVINLVWGKLFTLRGLVDMKKNKIL